MLPPATSFDLAVAINESIELAKEELRAVTRAELTVFPQSYQDVSDHLEADMQS